MCPLHSYTLLQYVPTHWWSGGKSLRILVLLCKLNYFVNLEGARFLNEHCFYCIDSCKFHVVCKITVHDECKKRTFNKTLQELSQFSENKNVSVPISYCSSKKKTFLRIDVFLRTLSNDFCLYTFCFAVLKRVGIQVLQ